MLLGKSFFFLAKNLHSVLSCPLHSLSLLTICMFWWFHVWFVCFLYHFVVIVPHLLPSGRHRVKYLHVFLHSPIKKSVPLNLLVFSSSKQFPETTYEKTHVCFVFYLLAKAGSSSIISHKSIWRSWQLHCAWSCPCS